MQRMTFREIFCKLGARKSFALENKFTNFPLPSVLRPLPASKTKLSAWSLHCQAELLAVTTSPHFEALKAILGISANRV